MAQLKRYSLAKYRGVASKMICPGCGQRTWKPYVDEDGRPFSADFENADPQIRALAERVGRCDNERKCGYNYPPREFFAETKAGVPAHSADWKKPEPPKTARPLSFELVRQSAYPYKSVFGKWLRDDLRLPAEKLDQVMKDYWVGATNEGRIIYWLIDIEGKCRDGKFMAYRNDGHRDHDKHPRWARKEIINRYAALGKITQKRKDELLNELVIRRCFGEHLLADPRYKDKPVAIVEGEKSCLIASVTNPKFLWMACGGNGLNLNRIYPAIAQKRKIFIFPDVDMTQKWKEIADSINYPRLVWMGDYINARKASEKDDVGDIALREWLKDRDGAQPNSAEVSEPRTAQTRTAQEAQPCTAETEETEEEQAEMQKALHLLQLQVAHEWLGLTEPSVPLTMLFERLDLELIDEVKTEPDYIGF